ncbi:hypothetical protein GcC1_207039 [Golovinomyces cichoracearum]|uniref:Uncharacterized protein n=1 Tax=Golovinomyces cichoracearum TaxID=62708 RepID=A0A420HC29_9PEZI|nr:hypothetical protein GcC1_207039 [Golovinomyces cichoracearum]
MSSRLEFTTNPSSGVIVLQGTKNYLEWLYTIEVISNRTGFDDIRNFWKYIDPQKTEKPSIPNLSARPGPMDINPTVTTVSKLSPAELEDFKYRNSLWKDERIDIQEVERRLEAVQNKILGSISENLLPQLKRSTTVVEILQHLNDRFRPTDQARKQEIIQRWNSIKVVPSDRMISPWLDQWERIYEEAKELKLAQVEEPQPQYDFLFAIRPIDESWVTTNLVTIGLDLQQGKNIPDLLYFIREFRHHQKLTSIFSKSANDEFGGSNSSGVFTVYKGDTKSPSQPSTLSTIHKGKNQNGEKVPLCGKIHLYEKCFYINYENSKRPDYFQYSQETFDKTNKNLTPNNIEKLRKSLNSKFGYDPELTPSKALS